MVALVLLFDQLLRLVFDALDCAVNILRQGLEFVDTRRQRRIRLNKLPAIVNIQCSYDHRPQTNYDYYYYSTYSLSLVSNRVEHFADRGCEAGESVRDDFSFVRDAELFIDASSSLLDRFFHHLSLD